MRYFTPAEFECNCGRCDAGFDDMDQRFLERLDDARATARVPFVLTSAMRCPDYNRQVGGVPNSAHTTGHAADIACGNSSARARILAACVGAGFTRIGVSRSFIHVDNSPSLPDPRCWLY